MAILSEAIKTRNVLYEEHSKNMCSICMDNPIEFCVVPCGHTFCELCCDRMTTQCHICRCSNGTIIKLYFN
jgi:hypothetical protein